MANGENACPNSWANFNGSCFKVFMKSISLASARNFCWNIGNADLVSIHSNQENAFIKDLIKQTQFVTNLTTFRTGMVLTRSGTIFERIADQVQWLDETPVDFGNPSHIEQLDLPPWAVNEPDFFGWSENCMIIMGNGFWADKSCQMEAGGFICRRQLSDIASTFMIGIFLNPDNWVPNFYAATAYGIGGMMIGEWTGHIGVSLAIFCVASQVGFQTLSLLQRYLTIMRLEHPKLETISNQSQTKLVSFGFILLLTGGITIITRNISCEPENEEACLLGANGITWKLFTDNRLVGIPSIVLRWEELFYSFSAMMVNFVIVQGICILIALRLIRYLRANSKLFSIKTYRLHLQLVLSLLLQLLLPFVLVGIPVLVCLVLVAIFKIGNSIDPLFIYPWALLPSATSFELGIFFFEFYAFSNSVTIVLFVTPFRRYTSKLLRFNGLRRQFTRQRVQPINNQQNQIRNITVTPTSC